MGKTKWFLYVKEVLTHFYIMSYYIKWVKTFWTNSISQNLGNMILMGHPIQELKINKISLNF